MTNNPKIFSNELDQIPKTWERYEKELNDPDVHDQIIGAFENDKEQNVIELAAQDFVVSQPENMAQDYKNKKITENWDIRETNSRGTFFQKFTFAAAKRETEKAGKKLLASATIFQDIFINKYQWDKEAFIAWENLLVTNLLVDSDFDIGPWFLYVFADWSIFTMFNKNIGNKTKENGFFGIYKGNPNNANHPNLKDHLFSVRLEK